MVQVWYFSHNLSHTHGGMKRWFIESGMFIFIIFYIDLNCIFGLDSNSDIFDDFLSGFFFIFLSLKWYFFEFLYNFSKNPFLSRDKQNSPQKYHCKMFVPFERISSK